MHECIYPNESSKRGNVPCTVCADFPYFYVLRYKQRGGSTLIDNLAA